MARAEVDKKGVDFPTERGKSLSFGEGGRKVASCPRPAPGPPMAMRRKNCRHQTGSCVFFSHASKPQNEHVKTVSVLVSLPWRVTRLRHHPLHAGTTHPHTPYRADNAPRTGCQDWSHGATGLSQQTHSHKSKTNNPTHTLVRCPCKHERATPTHDSPLRRSHPATAMVASYT